MAEPPMGTSAARCYDMEPATTPDGLPPYGALAGRNLDSQALVPAFLHLASDYVPNMPLTGLEPVRPNEHRPSTCCVCQFRHRGYSASISHRPQLSTGQRRGYNGG